MLTRTHRALLVVAVAELLAMSLWFSATAAAPELAAAWGLSANETAWLTIAVQVGFVAGALLSSALTLSDVVPPRYLFAASAVAGAAVTAAIAAFVETATPAIALRFLTGVALAGVYPPGMKILTGWFEDGRGFAIGVLVGSLTVGSALPHLLRALGGVGHPRVVLYGAAGLATVGGALVLLVDPGPHQAPTAPFDPGAIGRILRDRGTMLANGGYFGHMWELYAVWTWIPAYLAASLAAGGAGTGESGTAAGLASLLAFGTIAVGGAGAVVAGSAADRVGRTTITSASMAVSGLACVAAGFLFGASLWVLVPFLLVWGFAIVADSAQFSAAVSELAEDSYVGTALTLQTAIGFLLTTVSIKLLPLVAEVVGWRWAFLPLAIGPAVGTLSMLRLRGHPDAEQLAGGRG
ncbi:MFS transporter [Halospeciosus flavus]|uniref:MFS transporter n=1 Tax=Halospeciosus flavus TaxID=3032283 RepID=A0ABD5Z1E8_9EURY|nr:MFS transporter [Halospeciosus flavus]